MTEVLLTVPPLCLWRVGVLWVSPVIQGLPVSLQARPHSPVDNDRGLGRDCQQQHGEQLSSHLLSSEVWGLRCEVWGLRCEVVLPPRLMSRNWSLISLMFCKVWRELWGLGQQWKQVREIDKDWPTSGVLIQDAELCCCSYLGYHSRTGLLPVIVKPWYFEILTNSLLVLYFRISLLTAVTLHWQLQYFLGIQFYTKYLVSM